MAVKNSACILLVYLAIAGHQVASDCEVQVPEPWPIPNLFVPRDSVVLMNCTPTGNSMFWAIALAGDPTMTQHRSTDSEFTDNGFYELPSVGMPTTLRLLINDTSRNNSGTEIICSKTYSTALITFEPAPLELSASISEPGISAINVSWTNSGQSSAAASVAELDYSLTISYGSTSHLLLLNRSHHIFKAPPGSPPCQIYDFSVTATPVGATYTGDGCSAPSAVLSGMLPSLPDVTTLESTVNYSLRYERDSTNEFVLTVHFKPADFCESYPVTAYMLLVEGTTNFAKSATSANNTVISVNNLPSNDMYTFHLVVSSDVGNISTTSRMIYTTDVQIITVMPTAGDLYNSMIRCYFVNGSTAEGCMVVLMGELGNTTVNLTRDNSCRTINTSYPVSSYTGVFGYDIESNGSIGSLAVPGVIANSSGGMMCNPSREQNAPNAIAVAAVVTTLIVLIMIIITSCMVSILLFKHKRSHRQIGIDKGSNSSSIKISSPDADNEDTELDEAVPVYDEPQKQVVSIRTAGDGADHSNQYNSTMYTQESPVKVDDVNKGAAMYAELSDGTEHFYHVLEGSRPPQGVKVPPPADDILPDEDAPPLPPPFIPDQELQAPPLPPAYQDISCLISRDSEAVINGMDT